MYSRHGNPITCGHCDGTTIVLDERIAGYIHYRVYGPGNYPGRVAKERAIQDWLLQIERLPGEETLEMLIQAWYVYLDNRGWAELIYNKVYVHTTLSSHDDQASLWRAIEEWLADPDTERSEDETIESLAEAWIEAAHRES